MANQIVIVTQARIGSNRFPAKVLKEINQTSLLRMHINRLQESKYSSHIVVATTKEEKATEIVKIANEAGICSYQGSTEDVLDRFYNAALPFKSHYVVRVTADCPLIDPDLLDSVIDFAISSNVDYASNTLLETYPDGQDVEVISWRALELAWRNAELKSEREHVTPYIRKNADFNGGHLFKAINYPSSVDYSKIRMTVDEPADLEAIGILIKELGAQRTWKDYADYILDHPEKFSNQKIQRNEGYLKSILREKGK